MRKHTPIPRGTLARGEALDGTPWWFVCTGGSRAAWRALPIGLDPRGQSLGELILHFRGPALGKRNLKHFHARITKEVVR